MFPELTGHAGHTRNAHPGTVTFIGTDGIACVESAAALPDWLKFAPGADGQLVPVVRIVRQSSDSGYSVRSFSADGRLLCVTLPVPSAPLAANPTTPQPRHESAGWF